MLILVTYCPPTMQAQLPAGQIGVNPVGDPTMAAGTAAPSQMSQFGTAAPSQIVQLDMARVTMDTNNPAAGPYGSPRGKPPPGAQQDPFKNGFLSRRML